MLRKKMEPGSLYIVYLFLPLLKFTSGLGNEENSLSDKQSCDNFLIKSNRKAMNRNWSNQKANPSLKTKREINKYNYK